MPLYFLNPIMPKDLNHYLVPGYLALCGVLLGFVFSGNGVTAGFKKFQRMFGTGLLVLALPLFQIWPKPAELPFVPYDPALLVQAQKDKKPVFIDFSAAWCLPCKELEIKTFSDSRVHEALKSWVLLKADLTQYSTGPVEDVKKAYDIMGVPTLVFVGKDGKEKKDLRAVGFIGVEEMLVKAAKTAD
jgi:thiol:disulfide interchange protein DsbD